MYRYTNSSYDMKSHHFITNLMHCGIVSRADTGLLICTYRLGANLAQRTLDCWRKETPLHTDTEHMTLLLSSPEWLNPSVTRICLGKVWIGDSVQSPCSTWTRSGRILSLSRDRQKAGNPIIIFLQRSYILLHILSVLKVF